MKYLSMVVALLFLMCQQSSKSDRFEIPELGFSFIEPSWQGVKNDAFTSILQKYNWNVRTAITKSTNLGSIDIVRYYKDSIPEDEDVCLEIGVGGLHESLQDFDKLIAFTRDTKYNIPDLKIIQPITETSVSGKRAISHSMSYTVPDEKGIPTKFYDKSIEIFMGNYIFDITILTKDGEDIEIFDNLIKTIVITE